jgi:hypothetical protein
LAKKKARTPPPPRRVQAPKQRAGKQSTATAADDRRRWILLYAMAGSGVVILVAVLAAIFVFHVGGKSANSKKKSSIGIPAAPGCSFHTYKMIGRGHLSTLNGPPPKYNSFPPTSGNHYYQPAPWNLYTDPVDQRILVHNLEHGGIVIQYGSKVPKATVKKLDDFYAADTNAMILAPYPKLGNKIALTAWTHLETCSRFVPKVFTAFRDKLRYNGPEHYSPDQLQQGM